MKFTRRKVAEKRKFFTNLNSSLEQLSNLISIVAVIMGGWWTYAHFIAFREGDENLSVSVAAVVGQPVANKSVTIVDIALKNIGKVPIWAESAEKSASSSWADHSGCELTVIEYDDYSQGQSDSQNVIDWQEGGGNKRIVVKDYNVLRGYRAFKRGNYVMNPGVEYHESVAIPTSSGKLYAIRARFFSANGWSNSDIKYVYVNPA